MPLVPFTKMVSLRIETQLAGSQLFGFFPPALGVQLAGCPLYKNYYIIVLKTQNDYKAYFSELWAPFVGAWLLASFVGTKFKVLLLAGYQSACPSRPRSSPVVADS